MKRAQQYKYEIALSVAGEDRAYAEALAEQLTKRNIRYFYDGEEKHVLWGKNMYPYLAELYQNQAHYCVIFISRHYAAKRWTNHEREAAQARAFQENEEYILPIRLDNTQLPGILPTVSYLEWPPETAETVADLIVKKLGREPYIPPRLSVSEAIVPITSPQPVSMTIPGKRGQRGDNAEDVVLQIYIQSIEKTYTAGNSTELTYRSALETLLKALVPEIVVTHEPARKEYGSPDYVISQKTNHGLMNIGYIEAKDVDMNLDAIEHDAELAEPKTRDGQQLKKYRHALGNLVLTNYLEFRWYLHGERCLSARLVSPQIEKGLAIKKKGAKKVADANPVQLMLGTHTQSTLEVARLLASFLTYSTEPISNAKDLAARMAHIAHIIRDMLIITFQQPEIPDTLNDLYEAFKQVLIPDLDVPKFADMFAQTLAYGLFAARYNHTSVEPFSRRDAARDIPNTNPFLASLFERITGRDLDNVPFVGFVDDLAQLLAQTDMNAVLADFGRRTRREDPIVHFYETFLTEYDPKLRELRGVYYTPDPVVSYIVRSVDHLLRTQFDCPSGLADTSQTTYSYNENGNKREKTSPRVLLLDPACGTGTFLYAVINHIRERYRKTGNAGMWSSYVREHLLPRIFGFELLIAPYAMAHLKLGMQLAALDLPDAERQNWSYDFKSKERLGLYLTNTLEEAMQRSDMLFAHSISDEANAAARVKQEYPVMVVLGNPPYSGHSANKGQWIIDLLHGMDSKTGKKTGNYFEVDGQALGERNPKWLNDDYVKFIRFAQWRIEQTGYGILAFITNHGYLDNPTFRGMRQSLMQSFDEIYVLDLHGNSKKKELSPDGEKDENVFDIQQGVAIGIFVKRNTHENRTATVYHAHLWGVREIYQKADHDQNLIGGKYYWLAANNIKTTIWTEIKPQSPFYLFTPQNIDMNSEYEQAWKITDVMPVNGWGIATRKDYLLVDFARENLIQCFKDIRILSANDAIVKYGIKQSPHWSFSEAKKQLSPDVENHIKPILFRPFDVRFVYYEKCMIERGDHRFELMSHLFHDNLSFITVRRSEIGGVPQHFYCSNTLSVLHSISAKEGNFVFPLYIYPKKGELPGIDGLDGLNVPSNERRPNLSPAFIADILRKLQLHFIPDGKGDLQQTFGPEDIFHYMYAIFHSPTYRERYAQFLKNDFPRLPLTSNIDLFRMLCSIGARLVMLHLMDESGSALPSYPQKGTNIVDAVHYTQPGEAWEQGRVWINKTQYFEGVSPTVWEFHVGGYQVCLKWLKDRKGRTLSYEDIEQYEKVVAALAETSSLMQQIDTVIDEHGGWPIA